MAPPELLIVVSWTKTLQCVGSSPLLPIPAVHGYLADPVAAYQALLAATPPHPHPCQPILTINQGDSQTIVTVFMLARALRVMLKSL